MATRKDQYLESARKWVIKGQLDRAIKDYEQIVALDPVDMKHRQKLAELLVRAGRKPSAINEYEAIGKYYAENGYYLKAIAVYKQIQKLDPEDLSIALKLGEYNARQGLVGNALAEYAFVLQHHQKAGDCLEELKVLERMVEVDPDNLDTLLKRAEARHSASLADEALQDFSRLALLLLKRGDTRSFDQICDRVRTLYPACSDFLVQVLEALVEAGEPRRAIPRLQEILKRDNRNLPVWHLLLRAHRISGDLPNQISILKHMLRFFPDDLQLREGLVSAYLESGDAESARSSLEGFFDTFLSRSAFETAEGLVLALLSRFPEDAGILSLLKKVYVASGDGEKLREVEGRMSPKASVQEAEPSEPTSEAETPVSAGAVESILAPLETSEPEEDLWEDELDLSLVEQLVAGPVSVDAAGEIAELDQQISTAEEIDVPSSLGGGEGMDVTDWGSPFGPYPGQEAGEGTGAFMFSGDHFGDGTALFSEEDLPDFDDFSSAIDDLFRDESPVSSPQPSAKYDPDQLLSAFRKGLEEQVDEADSESHYDLGIAYKEMGLFDDAIHEFQRASISPQRALDCLTLEGICLREKGDSGAAEDVFKKVLSADGATLEQRTSATYDLALLYEDAGRVGEAEGLYREVYAAMPDFRDVAAKLGMLQGGDDALMDLEVVE